MQELDNEYKESQCCAQKMSKNNVEWKCHNCKNHHSEDKRGSDGMTMQSTTKHNSNRKKEKEKINAARRFETVQQERQYSKSV